MILIVIKINLKQYSISHWYRHITGKFFITWWLDIQEATTKAIVGSSSLPCWFRVGVTLIDSNSLIGFKLSTRFIVFYLRIIISIWALSPSLSYPGHRGLWKIWILRPTLNRHSQSLLDFLTMTVINYTPPESLPLSLQFFFPYSTFSIANGLGA